MARVGSRGYVQFYKIHIHTPSLIPPPWEDQCEWHRMTRMAGPDCAVMCNLINIHTYTHTHTHTHTTGSQLPQVQDPTPERKRGIMRRTSGNQLPQPQPRDRKEGRGGNGE